MLKNDTRKEFKIDFNDEMFEECRRQINKKVLLCMRELAAGNYDGGSIAVGLKIKVEDAVHFIPVRDQFTKTVRQEEYQYRKPVVEYKTTLKLENKFEDKGEITGERELDERAGEFYAVKIDDGQLSMDSLNGYKN